MRQDVKQSLTRVDIARALRTVAERLEKNQGMPVHADGLGYEVFIDSRERLVIRVERTHSK